MIAAVAMLESATMARAKTARAASEHVSRSGPIDEEEWASVVAMRQQGGSCTPVDDQVIVGGCATSAAMAKAKRAASVPVRIKVRKENPFGASVGEGNVP